MDEEQRAMMSAAEGLLDKLEMTMQMIRFSKDRASLARRREELLAIREGFRALVQETESGKWKGALERLRAAVSDA